MNRQYILCPLTQAQCRYILQNRNQIQKITSDKILIDVLQQKIKTPSTDNNLQNKMQQQSYQCSQNTKLKYDYLKKQQQSQLYNMIKHQQNLQQQLANFQQKVNKQTLKSNYNQNIKQINNLKNILNDAQSLQILQKINKQLPNQNIINVIDSIYHNICDNQYKQNKLKIKQNQISIQRKKSLPAIQQYNYLHQQSYPPQISINVPPYGTSNYNYYDVVIQINRQQLTYQQYLKAVQQRLIAYIFCLKGPGINDFRQTITDKNFVISKQKHRLAIGSMVRTAFRNIQIFIQRKMKKDISALKRVQVTALLTPLLNIRKQFKKQHCTTFYRCIKTNYRLGTQPVLDKDVLQFYKAVVIRTRGPQFVAIVDRPLSINQIRKIKNKNYQQQILWTPTLHKYFAESYIKRKCLSGLKQQLQLRYCPAIPNHFFDHSRLRARSDKLFAIAVKKLNIFLDRNNMMNCIISMSDKLKKMISRSPQASQIRICLCKLYLSQKVQFKLVIQTVQKIKKMVNNFNNSLQNQQLQVPTQSTNEQDSVPLTHRIIKQKQKRNRGRARKIILGDPIKIVDKIQNQIHQQYKIQNKQQHQVNKVQEQIKNKKQHIYYSESESQSQQYHNHSANQELQKLSSIIKKSQEAAKHAKKQHRILKQLK